jgi:hypothetical protein
VLRWPIREGLLAYVEMMKDDARELYYQEMQLYGLHILKKPPKLPEILSG